MAGWQEQKQFLDFFDRHGVNLVNLCARCPSPTPGKKPVMKSQDRARDRAEAEKSLGWAWHENKRGAEIYIRPARWLPDGSPASWPMVFLDDVMPAQAAEIAHEFSALVVETSPGLCHVWLAVSRPLDEAERKALQVKLSVPFGGDPGSISGEHFGRLPGFYNHKRGGVASKILKVSAGRLYPVGDLDSLAPAAGTDQAAARASQPAAEPSLYESLGGWSTESEREFGWTIGRLRWARDRGTLEREIEHVRGQLEVQAASRGKHDPRDYARRTIDAAFERMR